MSERLTITMVRNAEPADRDYFLWDKSTSGFGIKICRGGRKSFVCKYRVGRGRRAPTKRVTKGNFGVWTVEQARQEARRIIGAVANGDDPAHAAQLKRRELTVAELCDKYLKHGLGTKKPSTIVTDRGRITRHIKPLLGKKRIGDITKADVASFMTEVAGGKTAQTIKTKKHGLARVSGGTGTATRTVGLLGGIFSYAIDAGLLENNPVRGVKRYKDKKVEHYLSIEEFRVLGNAMDEAARKGTNIRALNILYLLILTGARRGEIEKLKWSEFDPDKGFLRLSDSKTHQKTIPLNKWACEIINSQPRPQDSQYIFPATRGNGFYTGTSKVWSKLRKGSPLEKYRLHDLRHSFASIAVENGSSLPIIGKLLGHKNFATTQRYAHLADDPLRQVTNSAGSLIAKATQTILSQADEEAA